MTEYAARGVLVSAIKEPGDIAGRRAGISAMKQNSVDRGSLLVAALGMLAGQAAQAAGLERLYILNCGEGTAGDISRWSPGVNVGKSMPFVDNCYLLKHGQGWMLWDTGLADAIAAMPDG